jgi:acyl carrier protein
MGAREWTKFRDELVRVLAHKGIVATMVVPTASLTEDLGMDSFEFVDLTVAIEGAFGMSRFPMQEWIDAESRERETRLTAGSLFDFILAVSNAKGS